MTLENTTQSPSFITKLKSINIVNQIIIAIVFGVILAVVSPKLAMSFSILGDLFVNALKAVAPILVLVLVAASIANQKPNSDANLKPIVGLYLIGTISAALIAVALSFLFPVHLTLDIVGASANPPQGLGEVLTTLAFKIVDNPFNAVITGNFIGILAWGLGLGFALKKASDSTKVMVDDLADAISSVVKLVIRFAPLGIMLSLIHI